MNPKEPLWLPRGSVRAILALLLVGVLCWLALTGKLEAAAFGAIVAGVVAYYFASKRDQPPPT